MRETPPPAAAWSVSLARVSRPYLLRLQALPRWGLLLGTLAVVAAGLFLPGIAGALFLTVLGLFLLWLGLLAWPQLQPLSRLIRLGVAVFVLGYAAAKAVGAV